MFQHADDTTLTLSDTNSVTEVLKFLICMEMHQALKSMHRSQKLCV